MAHEHRPLSIRPRRKNAAPLVLLATCALLVPVALPATGAGEREALVVPEGETLVAGPSLLVGDLTVLGTLTTDAAVDWVIQAARIHVGPGGRILGAAGAHGASAQGEDATAIPGAPGGSILLRADEVRVDEGGVIAAGPGGRGGDAAGAGLIRGGDGGHGGSVVVEASSTQILGHLLPGSGGAGGDAVEILDGSTPVGPETAVVAGDGGHTGVASLNGAMIPTAPDAPLLAASLPPQVQAVLDSLTQCGLTPVGTPGPSIGSLSGGAGGNACMTAFGVPGAPGRDCLAINSNAGEAGQPGTSASATARGGDGGAGLNAGASGGAGGLALATALAGNGGRGGDCAKELSAGGAGGSGAGATATANGGHGGNGADSLGIGGGGAAGAGGAAVATARGGQGGAGGNGGTATTADGSTSVGGAGGTGGGSKATATAGNGGTAGGSVGGTGGTGGGGGSAQASAAAGHGGHGGNGTAVGGNGGSAGFPTSATAVGGNGGGGGSGVVGGTGGNGGDAQTLVDPVGGAGGQPNGVGGRGGDWTSTAKGGNGGDACRGDPSPQRDGAPGRGGDGTAGSPADGAAGGPGPGGNGLSGVGTATATNGAHGTLGGPHCPDQEADGPSAAVVFLFDDEGDAPPSFFVNPGWLCGDFSFTDGLASIECIPLIAAISSPLVATSLSLTCNNPFARAGGTFMTSGSASATIACLELGAGPCTTSWTLSQGGCDVSLQGTYQFPLRCSVSANGVVVTPGAKFYGTCGNGAS